MTTTAFDDQFTPSTQTIEIVHAPYEPVAILKRNVAELELALKRQTERAEAAEAELARLAQQKPVAWRHENGNIFLPWQKDLIVTGAVFSPLYAAPVPAPAVPNEIGLGKGEFVIWPVKIGGVHGLAFVKTNDPQAVGAFHAEPEDGQIELGAGDSVIHFGNAESAMVLAERLQYVIALLQSAEVQAVGKWQLTPATTHPVDRKAGEVRHD